MRVTERGGALAGNNGVNSMESVDWSKEPGYAKACLPNGDKYAYVMEYDGRKLPSFENSFVARVSEIKEKFVSREGDVLIYGYMKSGELLLIKVDLIKAHRFYRIYDITYSQNSRPQL